MGNIGFYGFSKHKTTIKPPVQYLSYPLYFSNLLMWISSDAIVGLNDGDLVASWPDNTGLATIAQSNATYKPAYKTSILGAFPVVRFTYGNYMTITNMTIGDTVTYMAVTQNKTQANTTSTHKPILAGVGDPYAAGATSWGFGYRKPGADGFLVGKSSTVSVGYSLSPTEGFEVISFVRTGSQADLYRNGVNLATNGAYTGSGGSALGYWLGGQTSDATRRYQGDMVEIMVWSVALSNEDRAYMERALLGKYGLS